MQMTATASLANHSKPSKRAQFLLKPDHSHRFLSQDMSRNGYGSEALLDLSQL